MRVIHHSKRQATSTSHSQLLQLQVQLTELADKEGIQTKLCFIDLALRTKRQYARKSHIENPHRLKRVNQPRDVYYP
jgi:hypothetical protein